MPVDLMYIYIYIYIVYISWVSVYTQNVIFKNLSENRKNRKRTYRDYGLFRKPAGSHT